MRTYINMKTVFFFLIVLFLVSTISITTSDAQDAPQLINTLIGHDQAVLSVAFSPDSATIASGSSDHTAILWDPRTGDLRHSLPHTFYNNSRDQVKDVAFGPEGTILASIIEGSVVHLWNVETGTLRNRFFADTSGSVSIAFSPDGTTVATGDGHRDNRVRLWDVATGEARYILKGHTDAVYDLAFSPDGTILASGAWDGTIRLWEAATGAPLNRLQHGPGSRIHSVAFSPDGTILAGAQDSDVHFWDVSTGTRRNTIDADGVIQSVAFSPDGTTLAGGGNGPKVRLWDVASGTLKYTLTDAQGTITSVDISPDGTMLAAGTWADKAIYVWQLAPTPAPIALTPDSVPDQTFTVGTPVNLTLPIATGGTAPYTYNLSPIPAGLFFDTTTQLLSGTPTTATPATLTTYTATDATGASASLTFTITVTDAPTTPITFVPGVIDDLTLPINTPMDPVYLPLAEGGTPPYTYTLDPIPVGLSFDATIQLLSGTPTAVGTTAATYTATDTGGASAALTFSIEVIGDGPGPGTDPLDVNGDGEVTVIDLAIVALFYGTQVPVGVNLPADVNADGVVDLADLTAVAQGIDAAGGGLNQLTLWEVEAALLAAAEQAAELEAVAGAPGAAASLSVRLSAKNVADVLADVKLLVVEDVGLKKELTVLSEFLGLLVEMRTIPDATSLLPNYPNPFNPETWFPYYLSESADVTLRIYAANGQLVRKMALGHQFAGVYQSKSRAAYWDGKNENGEPVASGLYFYTLTAGDFTATRKLLIRK